MLRSVLPKKNPAAQGNGLSRDSANAAAAATVPVSHSHAGPEVGVNKKSPLGKGASLSTYVLRDIYLIVAEITSQ